MKPTIVKVGMLIHGIHMNSSQATSWETFLRMWDPKTKLYFVGFSSLKGREIITQLLFN
jgi:hypothetical protein